MTRIKSLVPLIALALPLAANAVDRVHTSTLKQVYPLANGDFVLTFDTDTSQCLGAGSPKYFYVSVGQASMTAEGSKKLYAAALVALAGRQSVTFVFDDTTAQCYVNRLTVNNS